MPRLSIITVNYNSGPLLEKTLQSLGWFASHSDIELIVIDGDSVDSSRLAVEAHRKDLSQCIMERDSGIYDAMNKGIKVSKGDWIWFINAGDVPTISPNVCLLYLEEAEKNNSNYIFSDLSISGVRHQQSFSLRYLAVRMINHQSSIYKRDLLEDYYDISFRYCADYAHLLKNYEKIISFRIPDLLCSYDLTGVSSIVTRSRRLAVWSERLRAQINAPMSPIVKICFVAISIMAILIKILSPAFGSLARK